MSIDLNKIRPDESWAFSDCTQSQTRYITHGYHTYPAKFIPQLAARLIEEHTCEGQVVVDPFMGSGTTLVEAMVHGRVGIGTDINPVAHLIAQVKTTPIEPEKLLKVYRELEADLQQANKQSDKLTRFLKTAIPEEGRLDYWFPKEQKERLGIIIGRITKTSEEDVRNFFLVAFSQILKSCSIWLQKSIKPTRDPNKVPAKPNSAFFRQSRYMLKQNLAFWNILPERIRDTPKAYRIVQCVDARSLPIDSGKAALIITSPPYVTSYEYADLHQLAGLWFEFFKSLPEFRKQFIGTAYSERPAIDLKSENANQICASLGTGKKAREVRNYFADMLECFQEMNRVLQVGGKACIVIGNTQLQGVDILNAEVFIEQMQNSGFGIHTISKREIPSKILPQTRDPESGRFTSSTNSKKVLAYPVEYILVMEKTNGL